MNWLEKQAAELEAAFEKAEADTKPKHKYFNVKWGSTPNVGRAKQIEDKAIKRVAKRMAEEIDKEILEGLLKWTGVGTHD